MKPDCSISWSLYNDSEYQWISTDPGFGTANDNLTCARCSEYMFRCLRGFGCKMKEQGRKIARVTLMVYQNHFGVKIDRYDPLITRENDMVNAVRALFTSWAYEEHMIPFSLEQLAQFVA